MSVLVTMADLATFRATLASQMAEWHVKLKNVGPAPEITVEPGMKYARIVVTNPGPQRHAYGFIDLTNGDLLKADGWKKPAKHARGNIFGPDPLKGCGPWGMAYLK